MKLTRPMTERMRLILAISVLRKEEERVELLRKSKSKDRQLADLDAAGRVFRRLLKSQGFPG